MGTVEKEGGRRKGPKVMCREGERAEAAWKAEDEQASRRKTTEPEPSTGWKQPHPNSPKGVNVAEAAKRKIQRES